jgi:hypothetical protein
MDEVATMFSFNNWFGHFSYLLIAISYWLTDIFWLRLVAAVGLSSSISFFRNETEVAGLIYQLLGRELAQKIKVSNQLISPASSLA